MIQQGVSAGESSSDPNGGGSPICRVMDYIEARLEAIRSREEEEEEDEEKERGKQAHTTAGDVKTEGKGRSGVQKAQQSQQQQQQSGTATPKPKEHVCLPFHLFRSKDRLIELIELIGTRFGFAAHFSTTHSFNTRPSTTPLNPPTPLSPPILLLPTPSLIRPLPQSLSLSTPQQRKTRASALSKEAVLAASQSTIPFALTPSPPSSTNLHNFRDAQQQSALSLDVPLPPVAIISPTPLSPPQLQLPFSHTHTNAPSYTQTYTSTVGTKRRLNTMLLDSGVQGVASGSTRRRTRSSRNLNNNSASAAAAVANNNSNNHSGSSPISSAGTNLSSGEGGTGEAMDVEEESGRERKRVARR
ncbi:hypothetical protein NLI96_g11435 [Meripilus lineatus]|uniref:Uncharacterized protein n=1 Tax=Meripilus lineatus TaxID=2056292 RepID=A0AAD5UU73_9APHY|nr:hypothetical protein NLI96_g11435 [Physisporinus lineatus]